MMMFITAYDAARIMDALLNATRANPDDARTVYWEELHDRFQRKLNEMEHGTEYPSSLDRP
jgi:hypothetical protein